MGKKYSIESILAFLFRYVWVLCAVILFFDGLTTLHTANLFMRRLSEDVTSSAKQALQNRIEINWKLGEALAQDPIITNYKVSLLDRAQSLVPYSRVYGLFLLGVTDEKGFISSTYAQRIRPLPQREYFTRVVRTGQPEITDIIIAGADKTTLNYTICFPYKDNEGTVRGTLILAINWKDINRLLHETTTAPSINFTLLGSRQQVMDSTEAGFHGLTLTDVLQRGTHSTPSEGIVANVTERTNSSFWDYINGGLYLVNHVPLNYTPWTLFVTISVLESCRSILIAFALKAVIYLLLFGAISRFGRMYTFKKMRDINTLLKQVSELQEQMRTENMVSGNEVSEVLALSQKGLRDELTGLPVRGIVLRQMAASLELAGESLQAALVILDVDDLKTINDSTGHEGGDAALRHFGQGLLDLEKDHGALVGRFGGDEFIAYLPYQDTASLLRHLEELRQRLNITLEVQGTQIAVHASMGVSLFPDHGDTFEDLYRKADKALYISKRLGKNRITVHQEDDTLQRAIPAL